MNFIELINELPDWLNAVAGVVLAANAITALTPTKVDDKALGIMGRAINISLKLLNFLSLNVLKNKNADDK